MQLLQPETNRNDSLFGFSYSRQIIENKKKMLSISPAAVD